VAARSDVVILVLTGSPQVEAVLTGEGGVLQGLRPGSVVIDCSTASRRPHCAWLKRCRRRAAASWMRR
jgi:3-hydroxyisobutyrate dehydrogenase-like beta-hydroxyacid dehydrogenase